MLCMKPKQSKPITGQERKLVILCGVVAIIMLLALLRKFW